MRTQLHGLPLIGAMCNSNARVFLEIYLPYSELKSIMAVKQICTLLLRGVIEYLRVLLGVNPACFFTLFAGVRAKSAVIIPLL